MCWTWGCRSPGTELSVQKCEGLVALCFSCVIRDLHMGAHFCACHFEQKEKKKGPCFMSRSVVAPSWFKVLPQKEQVEAEFYLTLIPKTIQWRCIISSKTCEMWHSPVLITAQQMPHESTWQGSFCTAGQPYWMAAGVADGSHCPLDQTGKALSDSSIRLCQKIPNVSKTLESYLLKKKNIGTLIQKYYSLFLFWC